MSQMRLTLIQ